MKNPIRDWYRGLCRVFSPVERVFLIVAITAITVGIFSFTHAVIRVHAAVQRANEAGPPRHHYKIVQKDLTYGQTQEWSSTNRALSISCMSTLATCAVLIEVQ